MTHPSRENLNNNEDGENDRQLLELELQKIRSEASAARLEAKAAEIEMIIRRLKANHSSAELASRDFDDRRIRVDAELKKVVDNATDGVERLPTKALHQFDSWNEIRSIQLAADPHSSSVQASAEEPVMRFDGPHDDLQSSRVSPSRSESQSNALIPSHHLSPELVSAEDSLTDVDEIKFDETESTFTTDEDQRLTSDDQTAEYAGQLSEGWNVDEEERPRRRVKPAAMLVSGLVHVGVLLVLAMMALQIHSPKDQVAFTASAASSEEVAMESFSIENVNEPVPETDVTEPTPAETEYEVSPIGEFKAADFATDAIVSPVSSMAAAMTSQNEATATAKILESSSATKIEFCGVEGGGNHFVYLVDSSGSMGDAFESARRELLASIDLLSPDQRFYVVFFDAQPDFMRISDPGVDETRSVYATPENKAALRRWAMRIGKDRGKAPYDPLKFALSLRADVIFLLSDGEFPEGIPKLLQEKNRVENLFGESKPISIVHTIGYFSKEGASIMTRIAKQNFGQYRHVPKP